jgi:hypothetical protein
MAEGVFTVRIPPAKQQQLDALAQALDRSRNWIVSAAIANTSTSRGSRSSRSITVLRKRTEESWSPMQTLWPQPAPKSVWLVTPTHDQPMAPPSMVDPRSIEDERAPSKKAEEGLSCLLCISLYNHRFDSGSAFRLSTQMPLVYREPAIFHAATRHLSGAPAPLVFHKAGASHQCYHPPHL